MNPFRVYTDTLVFGGVFDEEFKNQSKSTRKLKIFLQRRTDFGKPGEDSILNWFMRANMQLKLILS